MTTTTRSPHPLMAELLQYLQFHGLSQRKLALAIGMDESQMSRYATGRATPTLTNFDRMRAAAERLAEEAHR